MRKCCVTSHVTLMFVGTSRNSGDPPDIQRTDSTEKTISIASFESRQNPVLVTVFTFLLFVVIPVIDRNNDKI